MGDEKKFNWHGFAFTHREHTDMPNSDEERDDALLDLHARMKVMEAQAENYAVDKKALSAWMQDTQDLSTALHDRVKALETDGLPASAFLKLSKRVDVLEGGGSRELGMALAYKEGQEAAAKELFGFKVCVAEFVEWLRDCKRAVVLDRTAFVADTGEVTYRQFLLAKLANLGLAKKEG